MHLKNKVLLLLAPLQLWQQILATSLFPVAGIHSSTSSFHPPVEDDAETTAAASTTSSAFTSFSIVGGSSQQQQQQQPSSTDSSTTVNGSSLYDALQLNNSTSNKVSIRASGDDDDEAVREGGDKLSSVSYANDSSYNWRTIQEKASAEDEGGNRSFAMSP